MRILRWGVALGALLVWAGLSGCPIPGLTPVTPAPFQFPGFPADARLTGRFLFGGLPPPPDLEARYRVSGGAVSSERATADAQGYFYFTTPATGEFQVVWDDGGEEVKDSKVNTIGYYVSDPINAPAQDRTGPQVVLDLFWRAGATPGQGETFGGAFGFEPIPHLAADYAVSIFSEARAPVAETPTSSAGPIPWNRKSKSGATFPAGRYLYKIKFQKPGNTWGRDAFFGSTKFVPFNLPADPG